MSEELTTNAVQIRHQGTVQSSTDRQQRRELMALKPVLHGTTKSLFKGQEELPVGGSIGSH